MNVINYRNFNIYPEGEPIFANHFRRHGCATAVAGKWQLRLGSVGGATPDVAGFATQCLWNYPGTTHERYLNPSLIADGKPMALPKDIYGPSVTTEMETHVPLVANFPGTILPRKVSGDLVGFSDFLPSLVEAVGLPPMQVAEVTSSAPFAMSRHFVHTRRQCCRSQIQAPPTGSSGSSDVDGFFIGYLFMYEGWKLKHSTASEGNWSFVPDVPFLTEPRRGASRESAARRCQGRRAPGQATRRPATQWFVS